MISVSVLNDTFLYAPYLTSVTLSVNSQNYETFCRYRPRLHGSGQVFARTKLASFHLAFTRDRRTVRIFERLRQCLHGRGFICNCIDFAAVTPFVYTAPVELVIRTGSFWKRFRKWSVCKTIRFHWSCKRRNRIDLKRSGSNLAGSRSKYGNSRTECSALLHNHNFHLWFSFAFAAFVYFTINREPYRNNRQRCLEMLTFSLIRSLPPGGGDLTKFCTGMFRPEVQPLTLSYTILAEKVPLLYTFYWKKVPLSRFRKSCSSFYAMLNIWTSTTFRASIRKIIIKGPFKYLNDRFPYPFIYHNFTC